MRKTYWLYGVLLGIVLVVLQAVESRTLIRELRIEVFGVVIGIAFLGLGIWLGRGRRQEKTTAVAESATADMPDKADPATFGISPRELEVLELMVEGLSNQEIADRLFVSLNTVKTHASNLYQKLEVQRRAQAIRKATDLGLVLSGDSPKSPERMRE
ncbi:MAG TPA: helix-turn-helix transcriptional regulator [Cytophagales bacterium]|nr:helix-turn-helix transcriptional regulator [Cytophagales bacterium]HAA24294.1 helix-turn-helix transcriptional regulator [Cytophagales bacterium]HAP64348.1 helix-turn-helix transcriptional regulator [Cytophagales bacterium]